MMPISTTQSSPSKKKFGLFQSNAWNSLRAGLAILGLLGIFAEPIAAQTVNKVQSVDDVVAIVNSGLITRREMLDRANLVEREYKASNRQLPSRPDLLGIVLERLIIERIQMQMANDEGVKVSDADLEKAMQKIAQQNNMTLVQYKEKLESAGIGFIKFTNDLRQEMQVARLREREVDSKVQVFDGEIDSYLAQRTGTAVNANEELNLSQILVSVPENASPSVVAERQAEAEAILKEARNNANFEDVAKAHSGNPEVQYGNLGFRTADRLPQLFLDAASNLQAGEVANIVRSPNGFHILKVIDKRSGANGTMKVVQTHVRHILLPVSGNASDAEVKKAILDIRAQLDKGADFAQLAQRYSKDGSAKNGGDIGWISPGETVPEFEAVLNTLKPGQISEPIRTEFGYHLAQVIERRENQVSIEKQRDVARMAIREHKLEQAYQEWIRQLRQNAFVEYRVGNGDQ